MSPEHSSCDDYKECSTEKRGLARLETCMENEKGAQAVLSRQISRTCCHHNCYDYNCVKRPDWSVAKCAKSPLSSHNRPNSMRHTIVIVALLIKTAM